MVLGETEGRQRVVVLGVELAGTFSVAYLGTIKGSGL